MLRRDLDLLATIALAALLYILSALPEFPGDVLARSMVGVPMVLFVPGYAIAAVIWLHGSLRPGERFVLSLGMSLGLAALCGLVLYLTGLGLRPFSWAVALGVPTLVCSVVAIARRPEVHTTGAMSLSSSLSLRKFDGPAVALVAAAGVVTLGAVGVAMLSASQQRQGFSELWLVHPADTSAGDHIDVGLRSMELQPTHFRLQVLDGDHVALDLSDIELSSGQTWQTSLQVGPELTTSGSIQAVVYRADAPDTPYRHVTLRPTQKG
jgi:hypothetical protein